MLDRFVEPHEVNGILKEVAGTILEEFARQILRGIPGDDDDLDLLVDLSYELQRFRSVHVRHGNVEEDGVWPVFLGPQKGLLAVAGREYSVTEILENSSIVARNSVSSSTKRRLNCSICLAGLDSRRWREVPLNEECRQVEYTQANEGRKAKRAETGRFRLRALEKRLRCSRVAASRY